MMNNKPESIPVMDYRQYRRVRRLVYACCNYINGISYNGLHIKRAIKKQSTIAICTQETEVNNKS